MVTYQIFFKADDGASFLIIIYPRLMFSKQFFLLCVKSLCKLSFLLYKKSTPGGPLNRWQNGQNYLQIDAIYFISNLRNIFYVSDLSTPDKLIDVIKLVPNLRFEHVEELFVTTKTAWRHKPNIN